jgi:general stress protein YciG
MTEHTSSQTKPARRGFAAMDKNRQREIARKGGASVPDEKRSFSQDRDLAASAGRKGGEASHGGGRRRATPGETQQS